MGSYHPEHTDMYYPINYGYVEGVMAPDGAEMMKRKDIMGHVIENVELTVTTFGAFTNVVVIKNPILFCGCFPSEL